MNVLWPSNSFAASRIALTTLNAIGAPRLPPARGRRFWKRSRSRTPAWARRSSRPGKSALPSTDLGPGVRPEFQFAFRRADEVAPKLALGEIGRAAGREKKGQEV